MWWLQCWNLCNVLVVTRYGTYGNCSVLLSYLHQPKIIFIFIFYDSIVVCESTRRSWKITVRSIVSCKWNWMHIPSHVKQFFFLKRWNNFFLKNKNMNWYLIKLKLIFFFKTKKGIEQEEELRRHATRKRWLCL